MAQEYSDLSLPAVNTTFDGSRTESRGLTLDPLVVVEHSGEILE